LVERYFQRTLSYSLRRFVLELALVLFPIKMIIGVVVGTACGAMGIDCPVRLATDLLAEAGVPTLVITAVLMAPLLETLIGQWVPIWLTSLFTKNTVALVSVSAFLFALGHVYVGFAGLLVTFPVGIVLSWSFVAMRRHSRWRAYWVTSAIHALHNGVSVAAYLALV